MRVKFRQRKPENIFRVLCFHAWKLCWKCIQLVGNVIIRISNRFVSEKFSGKLRKFILNYPRFSPKTRGNLRHTLTSNDEVKQSTKESFLFRFFCLHPITFCCVWVSSGLSSGNWIRDSRKKPELSHKITRNSPLNSRLYFSSSLQLLRKLTWLFSNSLDSNSLNQTSSSVTFRFSLSSGSNRSENGKWKFKKPQKFLLHVSQKAFLEFSKSHNE